MNFINIVLYVAFLALALLCYVQDKRLTRLEKLWAELVPTDDFPILEDDHE